MTTTAIQISAPRLPYHPQFNDKLGVTLSQWKVITDNIFPAAKSVDSIIMALTYCKARNLDIFKKPVQIVPIWDNNKRTMVDTIWVGITELRTTAMRTGVYAGVDDTAFGPDVTEELSGATVTYPEWAQVTVYRIVHGVRCPYVGPKVWWKETYATAKRDTTAPNSMWSKRARGQLEKCAEAAALRRAFPEEIGNEYTAEEMAGRTIEVPPSSKHHAPDPFAADDEAILDVVAEVVEPEPEAGTGQWDVMADTDPQTVDDRISGAVAACEQPDELDALWKATVDVRTHHQIDATTLFEDRLAAIKAKPEPAGE